MELTHKDLRNMVKEMLDTEDAGFNDWEINFLDSVWNWDGRYSDKQQEKIEKLYKEKM